jgi:protein ImuB
MVRILCAWSPDWAIANWIRRNPSASRGEAFALAASERGVRRLAAVDAQAAGLGLFAGQKATDAVALTPELTIAEADPAADTRALAGLADWCARFSPAVAVDPPDGLFLDITGVDHLWGGEAAMMADFVARLARNGLPVRAAIAPSPGAAWALAHFGPDRAIADEAIAALATLPVEALRLSGADAAQLRRLGLRTIGAVAALPRDQAGRRFGPEVMRRLDQALGAAPEAFAFVRPPNPWFARLAFAEPISAPEDLARVAGDIVARLCARLEAEGRGARRFDLAFHRLDGVAEAVSVGLALPGRDAAAITRLFLPLLERIDPGFGIEVVTLGARETAAHVARQPGLPPLPGDSHDRETLAPLVDRLANRLGEAAVWRAEAFPSHAPERAVARRPPLSTPTDGGWDRERPRPVRLFRRPEPVEAVAPVPDDPPVMFRWRGRTHKVRHAEGPERLGEEWWRRPWSEADPASARDYYQVEDEDGARFWLFRDSPYGGAEPPGWWLHGLFG